MNQSFAKDSGNPRKLQNILQNTNRFLFCKYEKEGNNGTDSNPVGALSSMLRDSPFELRIPSTDNHRIIE